MSVGNKITVNSSVLEKLLSFTKSRSPKNKEAVKFRISDNNLSVPFEDDIDIKCKTNFQVEVSFNQVKALANILKHLPEQEMRLTLDSKKGIMIDRIKLL
jgi:hypothetical protein